MLLIDVEQRFGDALCFLVVIADTHKHTPGLVGYAAELDGNPCKIFTNPINVGGNAVASICLSVRPSVCLLSVFGTVRLLTLNFCI